VSGGVTLANAVYGSQPYKDVREQRVALLLLAKAFGVLIGPLKQIDHVRSELPMALIDLQLRNAAHEPSLTGTNFPGTL
jgi:hypothetical protein